MGRLSGGRWGSSSCIGLSGSLRAAKNLELGLNGYGLAWGALKQVLRPPIRFQTGKFSRKKILKKSQNSSRNESMHRMKINL